MQRWGVREVLMVIYGAVWALVVLLIAWRTQDLHDIPNGLLAALGVGEGALMAAFRADEYAARSVNRAPPPDIDAKDTPKS